MNIRKTLLASGAIVAAATFSVMAHAGPILFTGLSPTNIHDFGSGPQWFSGDLSLPGGTTIGPGSSIELDLSLSGDVTTIANGASGGYGAGIVFEPSVAPGAEIFGFSYQLLLGGVDVGLPFGFDLTNPFAFSVDNVTTGFPGGGPGSVNFDEIQVTVYNTTLVETVSDFSVFLSVPAGVPESSSTFALLIVGILAMAGIGYRKAASSRGA